MQTEARKTRRTVNACIPCRQSKIKCSGEEPCANCRRRIVRCRFADAGNSVMVSERYLRELQKQAQDQSRNSPGLLSPTSQSQSARNQPSDPAPGSSKTSNDGPIHSESTAHELSPEQPAGHALSIHTSPFSAPSATIKNTHENRRGWIWLAPSSAWSFTVRLCLMLAAKLDIEDSGIPPSYFGADIYPVSWKTCPEDVVPDISGLPSIDHALYLFNTVKFHLGQHYRFFDEGKFLQHVHEFYYGNGPQKASNCRLWFAQFLLVLAFGNAFLSRSRNPHEPPGAKYFVRAMSLIPDLASLWKDSLLATEVLAQVGLYLYSIDHRESAHVYMGQAIRIAQLEGLHTRLPEKELGSSVVARCRDLWWTLYIMDRHFSSSLGLPMSTSDSDITVLSNPSSTGSQEDTILSLQAKLWHLLSVILSTVYKTEQTELGVFLGTIRSILHTLAGHAQEIEKIISVKFQNSVDTMPKGTRHIMLLYHQCVIVATRPLLLSVLNERLEKLDHGDEDWQSFFARTTTSISTGIKSAVKTLQILSNEDSLLEVFLPFDLEFTYGAALYLIMASTLFPGVADDQGYAQQGHAILDEMVSKGNKVAEVRRAELVHLENLCQELAMRSEQRGLQTLTLAGLEGVEADTDNNNNNNNNNNNMTGRVEQESATSAPDSAEMVPPLMSRDPASSTSLTDLDPHISSNLELLDDIGISSGEFFSIVDQLGNQDIFSNGILDAHLNQQDSQM